MSTEYDFCGYCTANNIRCSDGRVIKPDAFKDCDGKVVPLVWNHQHNDVQNVLGHALLENRPKGVYAYAKFNKTQRGQDAKEGVENGDITAMSIFANQLQHNGSDVVHGIIREVSLVLAGANPGAYIEEISHSDDGYGDAATIFIDEVNCGLSLEHAEEETEDTKEDSAESDDEETIKDIIESMDDKQKQIAFALIAKAMNEARGGEEEEEVSHAEADETEEDEDKDEDMSAETVQDILDSMTEKQRTALEAIIGEILSHSDTDEETENSINEGDNTEMKHNVFDEETQQNDEVLSHSEMMAVINDGKKYGSMKESALAHGIENIDYLFPEAKAVDAVPQLISRDHDWVTYVMSNVGHSPFSRIKSVEADLTADEARAKGYTKGKKKVEEVISLLKRSTTPTTVYKKQKLDRDDVIDITDFDVVAMIKSEMRYMLDEELARAFLVSDGRSAASDDKIKEDNIRPIWTDDDLYTIKAGITLAADATEDDKAKAIIRAAVKARKNYKGSGNPVLFTTEDTLTDMLLLEDNIGRRLYDNVNTLATAMRVSNIITVPVMEGLTRQVASGAKNYNHELLGIIVNMKDYKVGADKGGAVSMFEDFDIDYNAQKYLIETRCSGALTKPYSAIAIEAVSEAT